MAVDEDITAYSTTASSNTPGGSDNIGTDLDDHLRDIKKNLKIIAQNSSNRSAPGNIRGRLWMDTSGSASSMFIMKVGNGSTTWGDFLYFNNSSGRTYCTIDTAQVAMSATTLSAGNALSGGGTLSSNRTFSVANASTATITHTAAILDLTVDPFGRVVSAATAATIATAAQMEDRSSTAAYVVPVRMKDHLGVAKFWVNFDANGTASIADSYNIASVIRSAAGTYTVNFTTGFADAKYAVFVQTLFRQGVAYTAGFATSKTTSSATVLTIRLDTAATADPERVDIMGFGYHAT